MIKELLQRFDGKCIFYDSCENMDEKSVTCHAESEASEYCGAYKEKEKWKKKS